MSSQKSVTYFLGVLILIVAAGSVVGGGYIIYVGGKGLAFVFTGMILSIAGFYRLHVAKTKYPSIEVPMQQTLLAEWICTTDEVKSYIMNVQGLTKSKAKSLGIGGFLVMFVIGKLFFDFSLLGNLAFGLLIPVAFGIGFLFQRNRFRKWLASDRKITITNSTVTMFGTRMPFLGETYWPEKISMKQDTEPSMLEITIKFSGPKGTTTQTYVPIPNGKMDEAVKLMELIRGQRPVEA